ncbi:MAG: 2-dehydropantoate 2-reductase, partial [Eubacterium sp.]|nr:2-dehydropantoate 2-reductase [Eubacterium sp.]
YRETIIIFSLIYPLGAALVYPNGRVVDVRKKEGAVKDTYVKLTHEIEDLGRAMGIEYDEDLVSRNIKINSTMPDDSTTSMHRDILKGNSSEIDGQLHYVVTLADKYGLDMPEYRKISKWAKERNIK